MRNTIDPIRLIFGLKLKQFRVDKGWSLQELSERCEISPSYLNEIEKGKKYPKTDKILALANALQIPYDDLISSDLKKALGPTGEILKTSFFTDIPFEFFGIEPSQVIEMIANAPAKFSALVNTLIKIGRSYNVSVEKLYFAVLRSYLEIHKDYFPELEKIAESFTLTEEITEQSLKKYLRVEHNLTADTFDPEKFTALVGLRTVVVPKTKKIYLNKSLSPQQRFFALARETGFRFMNIKTRPFTSTWVSVNSFDEVFNNFKASYFAACILIPKNELIRDFEKFLNQSRFSRSVFFNILNKYPVSAETIFYRMFSLFPAFFGLEKIYFLKFESTSGASDAKLVKEIHLVGQHDPQESRNEHYCRRWAGISILEDLHHAASTIEVIKTQISNFDHRGNTYFEISVAKTTQSGGQESITFGLELSDEVRSKIAFLGDPKIGERQVGQTCEKCSIFDCKERVAAPKALSRERHLSEIHKAIEQLR